MSRAILLIAVALASSGCSILFAPDLSLLDRDGGLDAGTDSGPVEDAGDGGQDAPDGFMDDAGPCRGQTVETDCANSMGAEPIDDDCDGLANCDDYDCASSLSCCGGERTIPTASSTFATVPAWPWMPSAIGAIPQMPGSIQDFGASGKARALRAPVCLPVDLGIRIRSSIRALGGAATCPAGPCDNYASIALTGTTEFMDGSEVVDELSVRIYHDGRAETRQNRRVRDAYTGTFAATPSADPISVTIDLAPGINPADGQAWIYATVTLEQAPMIWPAITHEPVFLREDLLGSEPPFDCDEALGLLVALQGIGRGNMILDLTTSRFECTNPGHFDPAGALGTTIDAATLRAQADWTGGGIGSPTIVSSLTAPRGSGGLDRWDILYDASNLERTNEGPATVHFSIGGAFTEVDAAGLMSFTGYRGPPRPAVRVAGDPLYGYDPPDCLGVTPMPPGDCSMLRSWREPSIFLPVDEIGRDVVGTPTLTIAFAREIAPNTDVFEIAAGSMFTNDSTQPIEYTEAAQTLLVPTAPCVSMRDPLLLPTAPDGSGSLLLFFTCDRGVGIPSTLGVATVTSPFPRAGAIADAAWLEPSDVGAFASAGLTDVEGAVWFHDGLATYRLWFLSRTLAEATVSFAEGTVEQGMIPEVRVYPASPVLRAGDPVLGGCPSSDPSDCDIESIAVTRIAAQPDRVRLLVSRTVEDTTIEHVLVPIEQVWPAL